jgi:hypothetical protein
MRGNAMLEWDGPISLAGCPANYVRKDETMLQTYARSYLQCVQLQDAETRLTASLPKSAPQP